MSLLENPGTVPERIEARRKFSVLIQ